MAKVVAVFDFDKTLIDCDSDDWVVEKLGVLDVFNRLQSTLPLNPLMDRMMMELHSRKKTIREIGECLKQIPLHPNIISAIKSAHASGWDLRIVSDANTFFIETILQHNGVMQCFSEINTNPSYVNEHGQLRILPYHSSSYSCKICPPNMCKGAMMEKMKASFCGEGKKQLIYVGDGTPDICAALKLERGDIVMPRKNFPLWDFIFSNKHLVKATIRDWIDDRDLGDKLLNLVAIDDNNSVAPEAWMPIDCKL